MALDIVRRQVSRSQSTEIMAIFLILACKLALVFAFQIWASGCALASQSDITCHFLRQKLT